MPTFVDILTTPARFWRWLRQTATDGVADVEHERVAWFGLCLASPFSDPMNDSNITPATPDDDAQISKLIGKLGHEEKEAHRHIDQHDYERLLDMVADRSPQAVARVLADYVLKRTAPACHRNDGLAGRMLHDAADLLDDSNGVGDPGSEQSEQAA